MSSSFFLRVDNDRFHFELNLLSYSLHRASERNMRNGTQHAVLDSSTIPTMLFGTPYTPIPKSGLAASSHSWKIKKEKRSSMRRRMIRMASPTSFGLQVRLSVPTSLGYLANYWVILFFIKLRPRVHWGLIVLCILASLYWRRSLRIFRYKFLPCFTGFFRCNSITVTLFLYCNHVQGQPTTWVATTWLGHQQLRLDMFQSWLFKGSGLLLSVVWSLQINNCIEDWQ